ncbi:MAG: hypothetical protein HPY53_12480 [Brevinematales bacterium]|nr:hypothetical protein [Brevinematales bacterium]
MFNYFFLYSFHNEDYSIVRHIALDVNDDVLAESIFYGPMGIEKKEGDVIKAEMTFIN